MSSPATITRMPRLASSLHTSTSPMSKNWASSMPTTSQSDESSRILADESMGVDMICFWSWLTTSSSEYLTSMAGLKISTFCRANCALRRRRISSSVLPENIEPHTTSILPGRCASPIIISVITATKIRKKTADYAEKIKIICKICEICEIFLLFTFHF